MTPRRRAALKKREQRIVRRAPWTKVADVVEAATVALALGDRAWANSTFQRVAQRGDALLHLALSAEGNGLSPAKAKKLLKTSRFFRRCASEIALLLWGDVEDVA